MAFLSPNNGVKVIAGINIEGRSTVKKRRGKGRRTRRKKKRKEKKSNNNIGILKEKQQ